MSFWIKMDFESETHSIYYVWSCFDKILEKVVRLKSSYKNK